jgi:ankyrin repeat protein
MIEEIYKQIFTLIKENKFKNLEELLIENKDINLDVHDENNNYIIHYLVNLNKIDLVKILLNRNIRLDLVDIDGRTILYYPIKFNYIKLFELLLDYNNKIIGISIIDIKDNLNNTPLHYATLLNNLQIVKKLIENNADPFIKNNNDDNVLQLALKYGKNDIIEYIFFVLIAVPYVQELEQKAELQSISEVIKKEGIGVPGNETAAPEESAVAARPLEQELASKLERTC